MTAEFALDRPRVQTSWDWRIAFYLFLAGTAGGLIFVELVLRSIGDLDETTATWGAWIGLSLAALSLLVLFTHLGAGARWRFLNVFRRPLTSWLSRGAIIVTVLMLLRIALLLPTVFEGLPWGEGSVAGTVLRAGVLVFAAAFMAYSGLVLSSWNSIPFWNTPLLPVLYVGYSFLGGVAALPIVALAASGRSEMDTVINTTWPLLLSLLAGNGALLLLYVWGMAATTASARESVRLLMRGHLAVSFLWGVAIAGLAVPIAVVAVASLASMTESAPAPMFIISGILVLFGGYMLRYCVLKAGVYAPLI